MKKLLLHTIILFFGLTILPHLVYAEDNSNDFFTDNDLNSYITSLTSINNYTPLEPAGSHGTIGCSLGLGMAVSKLENSGQIQNSQFYLGENAASSTLVMPKIFLIKGLISPLDIGVTLGSTQNTLVQQIGGHLQWTFYEAFARPALAARVSYNRLVGMPDSSVSSYKLEGLTSLGLFGYLTIYGGGGLQIHSVSVKYATLGDDQYSLNHQDSEKTATKNISEFSYFAGLQLRLLNPFYLASLEFQNPISSTQEYSLKLSMGI